MLVKLENAPELHVRYIGSGVPKIVVNDPMDTGHWAVFAGEGAGAAVAIASGFTTEDEANAWADDLAVKINGGGPATWQPIETAPKDGKEFLLYDIAQHELISENGNYTIIGLWRKGQIVEPDNFSPVKATHWMPLPPPPTT